MLDFQYPKLVIAIQKYKDFEQVITNSILKICQPFCSGCQGVCCREEMCRESLDSIWLSLIRISNGHSIRSYSDSQGWLTASGCALETGRPPVCHEFLCNKIISELEGTPLKTIADDLGRLINLVGKSIGGRNHLVTLATKQELRRVNYDKLIKAINGYSCIAVKHHTFLEKNNIGKVK